jgi:DNA (cytosine-5)-methyltransferase 1
MTHNERIEKILKPKKKFAFSAIDLFAGCGGLSLGFEANGISTIGFEMNNDASHTYITNLKGECNILKLTTLIKYPKADIIIGGPPCQPFSVLGNQLGSDDLRNGFPICLDAVKKVKPKVFVFENVRGLMFKNKWYLEDIRKEMQSLGYNISIQILNAKNFDVPQNRERVLIVGTKKKDFTFPRKKNYTISAGEALGDSVYQMHSNSKVVTSKMQKYIDNYELASKCITERDLHLDRPARTLTCRNLSGSTGDMHRIKLPNGEKRTLTIKEAAKLQTFPDWYEFKGSEASIFKQIGNAVPPMMSYHIARKVKEILEGS